MILEIGTSDFRTKAGDMNGIFIEPVKYYFDKLPKCNKENVAISNYEGEINIYYIPANVIETNKLPNWLRGCNSVNKIHDTIVKMDLTDYVVKDKVKVVRIKSILDKYNVTKIDLLKIDTEGHDCIILNDFLDTVNILPKTIQFENNVLSNKNEVKQLVKRLTTLGYLCKQKDFDMICKL
jgi:FkbM family methyltransferase